MSGVADALRWFSYGPWEKARRVKLDDKGREGVKFTRGKSVLVIDDDLAGQLAGLSLVNGALTMHGMAAADAAYRPSDSESGGRSADAAR